NLIKSGLRSCPKSEVVIKIGNSCDAKTGSSIKHVTGKPAIKENPIPAV
ncbi:hypothetical protein PanWU01x14_366680, partial [Parasponia andersonii]